VLAVSESTAWIGSEEANGCSFPSSAYRPRAEWCWRRPSARRPLAADNRWYHLVDTTQQAGRFEPRQVRRNQANRLAHLQSPDKQHLSLGKQSSDRVLAVWSQTAQYRMAQYRMAQYRMAQYRMALYRMAQYCTVLRSVDYTDWPEHCRPTANFANRSYDIVRTAMWSKEPRPQGPLTSCPTRFDLAMERYDTAMPTTNTDCLGFRRPPQLNRMNSVRTALSVAPGTCRKVLLSWYRPLVKHGQYLGTGRWLM
jgi:hypothetical protein